VKQKRIAGLKKAREAKEAKQRAKILNENTSKNKHVTTEHDGNDIGADASLTDSISDDGDNTHNNPTDHVNMSVRLGRGDDDDANDKDSDVDHGDNDPSVDSTADSHANQRNKRKRVLDRNTARMEENQRKRQRREPSQGKTTNDTNNSTMGRVLHWVAGATNDTLNILVATGVASIIYASACCVGEVLTGSGIKDAKKQEELVSHWIK
jgi:hypothetical protein